jgi:hypothetical protein
MGNPRKENLFTALAGLATQAVLSFFELSARILWLGM